VHSQNLDVVVVQGLIMLGEPHGIDPGNYKCLEDALNLNAFIKGTPQLQPQSVKRQVLVAVVDQRWTVGFLNLSSSGCLMLEKCQWIKTFVPTIAGELQKDLRW